jgi:hypothetical protein
LAIGREGDSAGSGKGGYGKGRAPQNIDIDSVIGGEGAIHAIGVDGAKDWIGDWEVVIGLPFEGDAVFKYPCAASISVVMRLDKECRLAVGRSEDRGGFIDGVSGGVEEGFGSERRGGGVKSYESLG